MGQSGIHTLNKVGASMYWGSMWDNKNCYSRLLREDIFLHVFFKLAFNDRISLNTINFDNVKKNKKSMFYTVYSHAIGIKRLPFKKYLSNLNKVKFYSTKLWVLKYQNWVIIYNFLYFKGLNKNSNKISKNPNSRTKRLNDNFFYINNCYIKSSRKIKNSFNLLRKQKKLFNKSF